MILEYKHKHFNRKYTQVYIHGEENMHLKINLGGKVTSHVFNVCDSGRNEKSVDIAQARGNYS
jgi:hypothetical protein